MEEIKRNQDPAQIRDRRPLRDIAKPKSRQGNFAYLKGVGEAIYGICAVIPKRA